MLAHVDTWIFDLDNTLYPAATNLFALIDARMGAYVARRLGLDPVAATRVQKDFFHAHGTTLRGLMNEHDVDPHEFLADVHAIDMAGVGHAPGLVAAIAALPGRKLIFTNADAPYAERVLGRIGLEGAFEAIYDVHAMAYWPKPDARAYAGLCAAHGIAPERALFVDDMARNLPPAKALGMTTVWVDNGSEQGPGDVPDGIDLRITDLEAWLTGVVAELEAA
ncbi:MAG: pyrimidine 5'-nucleotidase [Sphingomonadaceae bacterium]|nr:pyrimidine 5'-nucleotidase [Sphingomonadaceae bacterium]